MSNYYLSGYLSYPQIWPAKKDHPPSFSQNIESGKIPHGPPPHTQKQWQNCSTWKSKFEIIPTEEKQKARLGISFFNFLILLDLQFHFWPALRSSLRFSPTHSYMSWKGKLAKILGWREQDHEHAKVCSLCCWIRQALLLFCWVNNSH